MEPDENGGFRITGTHTFDFAPGTYPFGIQGRHQGQGRGRRLHRYQPDPEPPFFAVGASLTEYRARPVQEIVGAFTDYDPTLTADDFTATISWDDGDTSDGVIQAGGPNGFAFGVVNEDSVTFDTVGEHDATLTVTAKNGDTDTATVYIKVIEELDVVVRNPATYAGADFRGTVAGLTDADPGAAVNQYDVPQIDWGDGSLLDQGTVIPDPGTKGFLITGQHVYASPGQYSVVVSVNRLDGPVGSATGDANIQTPQLSAVTLDVPAPAFEGIAIAASGSFQAQGAFVPGDYHGTIDWGDASASTVGTVGLEWGRRSPSAAQLTHTTPAASTLRP